jgi:DNA-binding transcriptional MocR family regulator
MSLLFTVTRRTGTPVWRQIVDRIVALVDDGTLTPGSRLPATRALATALAVNRSTVCRAYEELWALGYLESRPGSYSTVRRRARALVGATREHEDRVDWSRHTSPGARAAFDGVRSLPRPPAGGPGCIDFASLTADESLCPMDDLRRAAKQVLARHEASLLDYGDPGGYAPLRDLLARRMRAHGVTVSSEEILVTHGAQQALDLVLRLLAPSASRVAVEVPTYGLMVPLLRLLGIGPIEIPLRPDGLDLQRLERALSADDPALVYTMPTFQNPTGVTTTQAHRERLLALCEAHGVPIVEDGFEEEMKYFGKSVLPIKSMDARGLVIYVGTFSKVVFPGLRIGWVAADGEIIRRLTALNRFCSLSGSTLDQAIVHRFCEAGRYEAYLRRLHAAYRRRMQALLDGLTRHMPHGRVAWTLPAGGCTLWLTVNGTTAAGEGCENALVCTARLNGVAVTPGSLFFPSPGDRPVAVRLSIARARAHEVDDGCRRLAAAIAATC